MDQLNRITQYFNEKERRRLDAKVQESGSAFPEMSMEEIRLSCLENNGYENPELNDKLYLHFRGFKAMTSYLDAYIHCKSIWLDSNGFNKIEHLDQLTELRCLYLSKNLLTQIEGLHTLQQLTILDLSNNRLTKLENLSCCVSLSTLNVAYNALSEAQSITHLSECLALNTIDLTNNRLPAEEEVLEALASIPAMVTLSINGNEVTKLPTFRKKMLIKCPKLGYLDRPVDESERYYAQAYANGGAAAEEMARKEWKEMQDEKRRAQLEESRKWQAEQAEIRRQQRVQYTAAGGTESAVRSSILVMSEEEIAQRRLEAEQAHRQEQEMLSLGVDKIAKKYWQLSGSVGNGQKEMRDGEDLLEKAAEQVKRDQAQAVSTPTAAAEVEVEDEDEDDEEAVVEPAVLPTSPTAIVEATDVVPMPPPPPPSAPVAEDDDDEEIEEVDQEEEQEQEDPQAQYERQQRVQDSFEIYKRQLREGNKTTSTAGQSTWEGRTTLETTAAAEEQNDAKMKKQNKEKEDREDENKPLYWTEAMDMELAKQVKLQVFDFDRISEMMIVAAENKLLQSLTVHTAPAKHLTNEACRVRWSQLDAQLWSQVAPGTTAQDTVFRINVTEEILALGRQPTYEELQSLTMTMKPKYLQVPISFPTMPSFAKENEDESDDEDGKAEDNLKSASAAVGSTAAWRRTAYGVDTVTTDREVEEEEAMVASSEGKGNEGDDNNVGVAEESKEDLMALD